MAHLKGNQWRESKRALDKKNRAKAKHFDYEGGQEFVDYYTKDVGKTGIVIGSALGRISLLADQAQVNCSVSPDAPRHLAKAVVVGDVVVLNESEDSLMVSGLTERRNVLSRMRRDASRRSYVGAQEQIIAANIDVAAIVTSAQNPPLHPKFIDRYMILLQHNDIDTVLCLNKGDLATGEERRILDEYNRLGVTTAETSAVDNTGIEKFKDLLRDKVAVFVGQSGVGKTSLINAIDPSASFRTGEVSTSSGRGRHTTSASTLHMWDENSYIIDTPGIRSLEIWDIEKSELQYYYQEFVPFIPDCKYPDCLHINEPLADCAVKQAINQPNGISQARYESYVKILDEL
jgi:ribosome biogenesis GTPase